MHVTSPAVLAQGIHKSGNSEADGITGPQTFSAGHASFPATNSSLKPSE